MNATDWENCVRVICRQWPARARAQELDWFSSVSRVRASTAMQAITSLASRPWPPRLQELLAACEEIDPRPLRDHELEHREPEFERWREINLLVQRQPTGEVSRTLRAWLDERRDPITGHVPEGKRPELLALLENLEALAWIPA